MYARVTLLEIDTLRIGMPEATALFREQVLPGLRQLPGYAGVLVMTTPEGKGIVVGLWETEEDLQNAAGFAAQAVESFATFYAAPPGREHYEVAVADLPTVATG